MNEGVIALAALFVVSFVVAVWCVTTDSRRTLFYFCVYCMLVCMLALSIAAVFYAFLGVVS